MEFSQKNLLASKASVIKHSNELRGTIVWMFWRRVLKMRNYKPIARWMDIYKLHDKPYALSCIIFERPKDGTTFEFHFSKNHPLYFIVKKKNKVFRSVDCLNIGEFEDAFKQYFRRKRPILPPGVGLLPDS